MVVFATPADDLVARAALAGGRHSSGLASGSEPVRVSDAVDAALGRQCGVWHRRSCGTAHPPHGLLDPHPV